MTSKKDLKDLKAPDEFQRIGQQAVPFLEQHGRNIVLGVVAFIAIFGGVAVFNHFQKRSQEAAMYKYGAALKVLEREVNVNAPTDETKKDDTKKGGVLDEEPPFKSEKEKDEAIVLKLSAFRTESQGSQAAVNAALPLAQAQMRLGKSEEALKLVEEYLKDADPNDPLRAVALETRGYALEATGKLDEASAAFEKLAQENKSDFMKGMGLYHHARILERKNDLTGAMKRYGEVSASASDSSAARLAKERMTLLAAKGVPMPVAPSTPSSLDAGS
jgi:predicted negative regulator of RcsB-dependent stress response